MYCRLKFLVSIALVGFIFEYCVTQTAAKKMSVGAATLDAKLLRRVLKDGNLFPSPKHGKGGRIPGETTATVLRETNTPDQQILPSLSDGEKKSDEEIESELEAIFTGLLNNSQTEDEKTFGDATKSSHAQIHTKTSQHAAEASDKEIHSTSSAILTEIFSDASPKAESEEVFAAAMAELFAPPERESFMSSDMNADAEKKAAAKKIFETLSSTPGARISATTNRKLSISAEKNAFGEQIQSSHTAKLAGLTNNHGKIEAESQGAVEPGTLAAFEKSLESQVQTANKKACACASLDEVEVLSQNASRTRGSFAIASTSKESQCPATISCNVPSQFAPQLLFAYGDIILNNNEPVVGAPGGEALQGVDCNANGYWKLKEGSEFDSFICFYVPHTAVNEKMKKEKEKVVQPLRNKLVAAAGVLTEEKEIISPKKFADCPCLPLVMLDQSATLNGSLTVGSAIATLSVTAKCEKTAVITCTVAKGLAPTLRFRFETSLTGNNVVGDVDGEASETVMCNRETGHWQRRDLEKMSFDEYTCFANNSGDALKEVHESTTKNQETTSTATITESETVNQGTTKAVTSPTTSEQQQRKSTCACKAFDEFETNPKTPGIVAGESIIFLSNDTNDCPSSAELHCAAPDVHIPKILLVREGILADQSIIAGRPKSKAIQRFSCLESGHWQSEESNETLDSFACFYACPCSPLASLELLRTDAARSPGITGTFNNTRYGCENLAIITCAAAAGLRPILSFQSEGEVAGDNNIGPVDQSALEPVNCNAKTGLWQRTGKNNHPFDQFSCYYSEEELFATLTPKSDGQNILVASVKEAKVSSPVNKSDSNTCVSFENLAFTSKDPGRNTGTYAVVPLDYTSSTPSTISLSCTAPAGFTPQLLLIRNGQTADKKIVNAQIDGQASEKFGCVDGFWSSRTFGNIDSFLCFFDCPCSPLAGRNRPGSEEEMLRGGEVDIAVNTDFGCEKSAKIRCSVAEGHLPVLSYRLQDVQAGESTIGFLKDVEDLATCDNVTGTWMRTFDNNSAFSEFSCFAQREENATISSLPLTTSTTRALETVSSEILPAVCAEDQSIVSYTLKKIKQFPEGAKTVTQYEISFENNGTKDICGGKLVYYIDLQERTIRDGNNLIPVGSFEVFPPRLVVNKGMYRTPDFMKIAAGKSRQGEIGLYVYGNSSETPVICTVSLATEHC